MLLTYNNKTYKNERPIDISGTYTRVSLGRYYRKVSQCNCNSLNETIIKNVNCCKSDKQKIIRSANTVLHKNYYTSNQQYLKERCKTYSQNNYSYDKVNGSSAVRPNCTFCNNSSSTYKPNNESFEQQGAVSASTRLLRLKYNNIQSSANLNPNLPVYRGEQTQNYFINNSKNICIRRNGDPTKCS